MEVINLLPPEEKRQLVAARSNSLLLRYSVLMLVVVGFLLLEVVGMNFVVDAGTAENNVIIAENKEKTKEYASSQEQAATFASDLKTAQYILNKQVPYTTIIFTLANNLPAGSIIESLSIDPSTFGNPTILTFKTKTPADAIAVKAALQKTVINDAPLFSSVKFESVLTNEAAGTAYPFNATYSVVYSKKVLPA